MKDYGNVPRIENFEAYRPSATARRVAQRRHVDVPDTLTKAQHSLTWICCLIAAGIMIETLYFKFTGAAESKYIFGRMGTEPWMRWVQGTWELLASIGLLLPPLRWAGGILTTGAMSAAILSHMTWLGVSIQGDHGLLFCMALVTFICGSTVLWLHRHDIPGYVPMTIY